MMSLKEARRWCGNFARSHYENFAVTSWFLPHSLRVGYLTLYAFARGADDLADDSRPDAPGESVRAHRIDNLRRWREWLQDAYAGRLLHHPAFIALRPLILKYVIEQELFERMIAAFEQDQRVSRYRSWEDLLAYTEGSANPVGRWVLRLHGYHDPDLDRYSDSICTALQLVNFLQDCRDDYLDRDRIYLPAEDLERFGVKEQDFTTIPTPQNLRRLLRFEAARAERLFIEGLPLLERVQPSLRRQLILFHGGGRVALHQLKRADYDISSGRIQVRPVQKTALIVRALSGRPL